MTLSIPDRPARPPRAITTAAGPTLLVTAHDGGAVTITAHQGNLAFTLELTSIEAYCLAEAARPDRFTPGDRAWWNGQWVTVEAGPYVGWSVTTQAGRRTSAGDGQLVTRRYREARQAEAAVADRAAEDEARAVEAATD